jgi:hypothetical protein
MALITNDLLKSPDPLVAVAGPLLIVSVTSTVIIGLALYSLEVSC